MRWALRRLSSSHFSLSIYRTALNIGRLIFELPMVSYFLARFGIVTPAFMKHYRRHAIVVILIIAAVVTPTTDPITMSVFSLPMFLLYEVSIWIAHIAQRKRAEAQEARA